MKRFVVLLSFVCLLAPGRALAEDEDARPPTPPTKPKPPVSLRVDGAYAPRKLFSIPVTGADVGIAGGMQPSERGALWGTMRGFLGTTENGLRVWSVRVGGEGELVFDRLRIGAGIGLFVLGVRRAVRDETILSWGPEARATARFDFVRETDFALFVHGALGAGYEVYDGSLFWGPTVGAGVAIDVAGRHARRD